MPDHKCSTCRHYEPAPMWKKGWCRNPLLYSPQQSHLVGEDDLDCNRGMGSYWEAIDPNANQPIDAVAREEVRRSAAARIETGRFTPPPPRSIAQATSLPPEAQAARRAAPARQTDEQPIMVRRGEGEATPRQRTRRRGQGAEPLRSNDPEGYASGPQEHYSWGDYLRRSYPVVGVILLLGAFWLWSARQLAGDTQTTPTPVAAPSVAPSAAPVVVITPSVPAAAGTGSASTLPVPPPGVIAPGAKVVVTTSGAGANIRDKPTIGGVIVTSQDDGVVLTITGNSQAADDYVWWPVQGDGFNGWVAEALIAPAP